MTTIYNLAADSDRFNPRVVRISAERDFFTDGAPLVQSKQVASFQLDSDGRICVNSNRADLPGWHQVVGKSDARTDSDVLEMLRSNRIDLRGLMVWQDVE